MANPFGAAAAKAASAPKAKAKKTEDIFTVTDPNIVKAIEAFVKASAEVKKYESDKEVCKGQAEPFCRGEFIKTFAEEGRQPETIKFRTPGGSQVTFVVQDRGEKYTVSDEQLSTITAIIGEEKAGKVVLRDLTFEFNNEVLNKDGVMDALGKKIEEMVKAKVLTPKEAEDLLVAKPRTTVKKGTLEDLARLCDNDVDKMEGLMAALGSHVVSYMKS